MINFVTLHLATPGIARGNQILSLLSHTEVSRNKSDARGADVRGGANSSPARNAPDCSSDPIASSTDPAAIWTSAPAPPAEDQVRARAVDQFAHVAPELRVAEGVAEVSAEELHGPGGRMARETRAQEPQAGTSVRWPSTAGPCSMGG